MLSCLIDDHVTGQSPYKEDSKHFCSLFQSKLFPVNTCFACHNKSNNEITGPASKTSMLNVLIYCCSGSSHPALQRPFPGTSWESLQSESPNVISLPLRRLLENRISGKLLTSGKFSQLPYRTTAVIPSKLQSKHAPQRPWEDAASKTALWHLWAQDYQKSWRIQ